MNSFKQQGRIFAKAVNAVMNEYCIEVNKCTEPIPAETKFVETKGLDVMIYFFEDIEGMLVLSMSRETAMGIAKAIDMDPESVDEQITREVIAELGNLSAARTAGMFAQQNIKTNITPPSIFCGKGSQIFCMIPDLIHFEVNTVLGTIDVSCAVRLKEKKTVYLS